MKPKLWLLVGAWLIASVRLAGASTYLVGTTNDGIGSSPLTLREALIEAEGGTAASPNIVLVPPGTYALDPNFGPLTYGRAAKQHLLLEATGGTATNTIIEQTGTNQVFNLNPAGFTNISVAMVNLTITGGNLEKTNVDGGAILEGTSVLFPSDNVLALTNCIFLRNAAHASGGLTLGDAGGAVAVEGGSLIAVGCLFGANAATNSVGGAIYFRPANPSETLYLSDCRFTNNLAGVGGAIAMERSTGLLETNGGGFITLSNCFFAGNQASGTTTEFRESARGGAIFAEVPAPFGPLNVLSCTFATNTCATSLGGGAIYLSAGGTTANIHYCRFIGNTVGGGLLVGGAIMVYEGNLVIDPSVLNDDDNWWGSNTGATAGEVAVESMFLAELPPTNFLQLTLAATSTNVPVNSRVGYTLSLLTDSSGAAISPANLAAFTGLPVSASSTFGALAPTAFTTAGPALDILATAGPGTGTVTLGLDSQVLATNITVVLPPPVLDSTTFLPDGTFQFTFASPPGLSFTVLTTTNLALPLASWTVAGRATDLSNGIYQFTTTPISAGPQCFYAVQSP